MNFSDQASDDPPVEKRVAVIGIHGVGDHDPGEVSRAISEQLLSLPRQVYKSAAPEGRVYLQAEGRALFPDGARPGGEPSQKPFERFKRGFGSAFLSRRQREISSDAPIDQRFTAALLAGGEHYTASCKAIVQPLLRQTGRRRTRVDVYDMHWSDLSHGGSGGGFKTFDQFAQLMLHVASLGRSTLATVLDHVRVEKEGREGLWRRAYKCSALGYWLLSMPILQGNLLFLLLAGLTVPALIPAFALAPTFGVVVGLLAAVVCAALGFNRGRNQNAAPRWVIPGSILIGVAAGVATGYGAGKLVALREILTGMELLCLLWIGHVGMRRHGKSRPGSLGLWWILVAGLALLNCISTWIAAPADLASSARLLNSIAHTMEGLFVILMLAWLGLFAVNALLVAHAFLLWATTEDKQDEKLRAVWTAMIAAAVPPPLLLSVILLAWTMLSAAFSKVIPDQQFTPWLAATILQHVDNLKRLPQAMIAVSATDALAPYLVLMVLAGLLLVWAVLPSIVAEIVPPRFRTSAAEKGREERCSAVLGNWLDGGFAAMGVAAVLAWIGFFVLLPIAHFYQVFPFAAPDWLSRLREGIGCMGTDIIVAKTAAWFGAGAGTLLAGTKLFGKNFSNFFRRLRVLVDTAMDVDNWLRERPRGNTPRLRIFARYHALLEQVRKGGYDKVVIVAHSQGTIVTADFFRYLKYQKPEFVASLPPIIFFTMGCPLRQLYAWRFPMLYGWGNRPPHAAQAGPNPAEFGFKAWHNAYGSGDYVGRSLWVPANPFNPWKLPCQAPDTLPDISEFCVGPLAHTHYFDADNLKIGQYLDDLIQCWRGVSSLESIHSSYGR